jgi:hypothetical protein
MRFWTSGIRIVWSLRFQQGFCLPDNADRDCSELGVPDAADRVLHSPRKTEPESLPARKVVTRRVLLNYRCLPPAVAGLSLLLVGCATTRNSSPVLYTLSDREIQAVESGLRSSRHDLDNPAFRGFRAAQHEDGQIDVCGWMRPNGNSAEFIGTLFAGTFALERFGGNEVENAQIVSDCKNRGTGIA